MAMNTHWMRHFAFTRKARHIQCETCQRNTHANTAQLARISNHTHVNFFRTMNGHSAHLYSCNSHPTQDLPASVWIECVSFCFGTCPNPGAHCMDPYRSTLFIAGTHTRRISRDTGIVPLVVAGRSNGQRKRDVAPPEP